MERIVYRKTLDVHKNGIQFTLQGFETADNMARKIEISLMASGDAIDLPLEQITAMMYVTTPSATEPSINACTIKDNTIIYDVLPIVEEGITEMQLKLIETGLDGAKGVLAAPRFAVEVTQSNTDDESATQTPTFTALEDAVAKAKGVYDSRLIGIEISKEFTFRAKYADGTIYESDVLKELSLHGDVLLSQSYAKGGTGIRAGEDTDNSMYYSNVSKSASAEVSRISGEATELLEEVTKHGVYTSFSVNFDTGEVEYISPSYDFKVNEESGELEAYGESYTPDETVEALFEEKTEEIIKEIDNSFEEKTEEIIKEIDNSFEEKTKDFITSKNPVPITQGGTGASTTNDALNNLGVGDYVIEQGVSGIWHYEKWKSGKIKLCGTELRSDITTDTKDGVVYRKANNHFPLPTDLGITFIYYVNATAGGLTKGAWSGQQYVSNEKESLVVDVFFGEQITTGVQVNFYLEAVGTWN